MRVHIITNLFSPDELAGAALFTDLALFLKQRGHDVRVSCTFSYYPAWALRPEDRGLALRDETFEGIPVRRVAMYVPSRPSGKTRMLSDLSFLLSLAARGPHPGWRPDAVLTALPMLSQCLAQRVLYMRRNIPRLIVVQDFVVDAALELGIVRLPGIGRLLHGIQRWALRSASTLVTISPCMLEKLRAIVGPDRRACVIPNWIHSTLEAEIARQGPDGHRRRRGLLLYSGNLGVKQGLPEFLSDFRVARANAREWSLAIHGGGAEMERLRLAAAATPGCSLGPVLNEHDYVAALMTSSACLVTQRPGVGADFLPSKLLPALATGTPVLAVCDPTSPLGREVVAGSYGEVVETGRLDALAKVLQKWLAEPDLLAAMSARASQRAAIFSRNRILSQYEQELLALAASTGATSELRSLARCSDDPSRREEAFAERT